MSYQLTSLDLVQCDTSVNHAKQVISIHNRLAQGTAASLIVVALPAFRHSVSYHHQYEEQLELYLIARAMDQKQKLVDSSSNRDERMRARREQTSGRGGYQQPRRSSAPPTPRSLQLTDNQGRPTQPRREDLSLIHI